MAAETQKGLSSTVTLNDGVTMPIFGLGMSMATSGVGGEAEQAVAWALEAGYRLIDTAFRYGYGLPFCTVYTYFYQKKSSEINTK